MAGKQLEFPGKQTHDKQFEKAVILFSLICILFVIIAINVVDGGTF